MVLTNTPPTDWTDQDRLQFSTNLAEFAAKFKRIEAIHFYKITRSDSTLHRISITKNTGKEYVNLIRFDEKEDSKFKPVLETHKNILHL